MWSNNAARLWLKKSNVRNRKISGNVEWSRPVTTHSVDLWPRDLARFSGPHRHQNSTVYAFSYASNPRPLLRQPRSDFRLIRWKHFMENKLRIFDRIRKRKPNPRNKCYLNKSTWQTEKKNWRILTLLRTLGVGGVDPVNNIILYIIILYIIYTYTAYGFPIRAASSRSASALVRGAFVRTPCTPQQKNPGYAYELLIITKLL